MKLYIISEKLKLSKTADLKYYSQRFLKCFDILLNDVKIGYLYTDPIRNTYYSNNDIISIRIDNEILYTPDLNNILDQVIKGLQIIVKGISRLDIAYDTDVDVMKRFKKFYNNIEKYSFKNRGKTTVNGTGPYDTQINIGSLRQGKTVIIYDKSSLLRQQSKDYLLGIYESVFGHKNIYRCEVRLTSKVLNKYDIDLMRLGDCGYLEGIFGGVMESLIDFRKCESNLNITRQDKIEFISLTGGMGLPKKVAGHKKMNGDNNMKYLIWKIHLDRNKEEFRNISMEMKVVEKKYSEMTGLNDWLRNKMVREDMNLK